MGDWAKGEFLHANQVPGKDFVLSRFTPEQREQIDPVIARACGAIATWIAVGLSSAMNQFNQKEGLSAED